MGRTFTRTAVATPYGHCKTCGTKTRSHLLEPAEYDIYLEEVIVGSSDTYASKGWEDVDEVEKYEQVLEPVVMCHSCWKDMQESFCTMVQANYERWMKDILAKSSAVKKAVNTQIYYDFEDPKTIAALKNLAQELKEVATRG